MLTRRRQQQNQEDRTLTLLKLPALVINEILDYLLDPGDLGALRGTCKSTKAWIDDQPNQLVKFPVVIKDKTTLDQVVRSSRLVRWSNLVFTQTHYGTKGGKGSIADLLQRCGPWLKSLTVGVQRNKYKDGHTLYRADSVTTEELIANFLTHLDSSSAPLLESLRLEGQYELRILRQGNDFYDERFREERAKLLEGLQGRLPQVRSFEFIPHLPLFGIWSWPFIQLFLSICPNLTSIGIPALAPRNSFPPPLPQIENPFMAYLQALVNKPPAQRPTQFSLDFCPDRDMLDPSESRYTEFENVFQLGLTELLELAKLGAQIGGKFWNVPLGAMVPFGEERRLGKQVGEALRATLGSILCKNVSSGIGQLQYYFPDPNIPIFFHLDLDRVDYSDFDLPEDSNVQSICIFPAQSDPQLPLYWDDVTGGDILQENLFKVVRPSVRALRMPQCMPVCRSHLDDDDDENEDGQEGTPYDLGHYFPSLRTLCVFNLQKLPNYWGHWDDDYPAPAPESCLATVLAHLPSTLEELSLDNCAVNPTWFFAPAAADGAATSPGNPQFVLKELKNLTKVSIVSCKLIEGEHGSDSEDDDEDDEGAEPCLDMKDKLYDALEALGLKEFVFTTY